MPTTGSLFLGSVRLGNPDSQWDVATINSGSDTVTLSWPQAGGSPTSYEVSINGQIENVGNVNSLAKTGLTIGTLYEFKVRPVYANGKRGGWSFVKQGSPTGWNEASGGTQTTVANYNGTGQTWRVHTFTSSGTLTVSKGVAPFSILVVGGGGGGQSVGGGGSSGINGNGGSGVNVTGNIATGSHTVTVGAGGAGNWGGCHGPGTGCAGGTSTFLTYTGTGGAAGGGGGTGQAPGPTSTITGSSVKYGGFNDGSRGAGGAGGTNGNGAAGGTAGVVIVAYRIA